MVHKITDTTCPDNACKGDCVIDREYLRYRYQGKKLKEIPHTDWMWKCTKCRVSWLHTVMLKENAEIPEKENL